MGGTVLCPECHPFAPAAQPPLRLSGACDLPNHTCFLSTHPPPSSSTGEQPLLVIRDVGIVTVSISWGQLGVVSEVGHKRHRRSWSGTSHYHLSPYPLSSPTSHTNVVLEPSMDQVWCCPSPNSPISIFPHPCSKDL